MQNNPKEYTRGSKSQPLEFGMEKVRIYTIVGKTAQIFSGLPFRFLLLLYPHDSWNSEYQPVNIQDVSCILRGQLVFLE